MKFAHEFRAALVQEDFPSRWIKAAVPYGQLKKCLKKVEGELREVGLEPATLKQFLDDNNVDYNLEQTNDSRQIRPRLAVTVHLQNGVLVDASLTPATRDFLQSLTGQSPQRTTPPTIPTETTTSLSSSSTSSSDSSSSPSPDESNPPTKDSTRKIEIPLVSDAHFFHLLHTDLLSLSDLLRDEEAAISSSIRVLRSDMTKVVRPPNIFHLHRTDMGVWREIFRLYLDGNIFFSTLEHDHGIRSGEKAARQLEWFGEEVRRAGLVERLGVKESRGVWERFVGLNGEILRNLRFQELNQKAVFKILKKFDKHTLLRAGPSFRLAATPNRMLAESVARDMCAHISNELMPLVPQLQDYLCPICECIASFPMRPGCGHIICSRCMNKMLRKGMVNCSMCRVDVTTRDNAPDVDWERERLNSKYFPKETKEKRIADRIERGRELHGDSYDAYNDCVVM